MKEFKDLGRKLVAIRAKRGLTQEQLAEQLNIPAPTYRMYEVAGAMPRINHPNFQSLFDLLKAESELLEQESKQG